MTLSYKWRFLPCTAHWRFCDLGIFQKEIRFFFLIFLLWVRVIQWADDILSAPVFFFWNCWSLHYTRKPLFLRKEIKFCTFSSHTEYVKRETIVIAWLTKNKFLLSMNVHVSYVLEHETSKKSFPSVCLYVRTSGRLQNLFGCTITFEGVSASKQNLVGVFYV